VINVTKAKTINSVLKNFNNGEAVDKIKVDVYCITNGLFRGAFYQRNSLLFTTLLTLLTPILPLAYIYRKWAGNNQRLTVYAPLPRGASLSMAPLFLDPEEVELFRFLVRTSHIVRGEKIILKYNGGQIYFPEMGGFFVNQRWHHLKTMRLGKVREPSAIRDGTLF